MTRVSVYNSDYVELNHAYNVIFHSYEQLIECADADDEVLSALETILRTMNPTLDRIKSEMTVKTRYKSDDQQPATGLPPESLFDSEDADDEGDGFAEGNILTGNFTGD